MILPLLLDSAMRSILLGLAAWTLLKLGRLNDSRTESAIWTAVLAAALSMPILSRYMPGLVLNLPRLAAPTESVTALRHFASHQASSLHGSDLSDCASAWFAVNGRGCLLGAYAMGLMVCAARLAAGLLLTVRLYRRAVPVTEEWAKGRNVRASFELKGPVSLAGAILLTADCAAWSKPKRDAVLAHEEAHIARGDFFVQLAARVHCAVFWFSPFAWWLKSKLAEIAETASDEAAIRCLNDRATYAEILVEVSRRAQNMPAFVAMAKDSFIERRVDHILSEAPQRNLSPRLRLFTVIGLTGLALAVAGAKAVVGPLDVAAPAPIAAAGAQTGVPGPVPKHAAKRMTAVTARPARAVRATQDVARNRDEAVGYDPRALLDPALTPKPHYEPASTIVHAGRVFYIRSTERPVADVSVTDGMNRQPH